MRAAIDLSNPLAERKNRWLVYGSSLSAPAFLPKAMERARPTVICTTNAGIYDIPRPDWYGVFEVDAPKFYSRFYLDAHARGTKIVTSTPAVRNIRELTAIASEVLDAEHYPGTETKPNFQIQFRRGMYVGGVPSGAHLTQFAINKGADAVILVGMEGYASTPSNKVMDTFDGRLGPNLGEQTTQKVYGPLMQSIVTACPDVFFWFFGKPRYPLMGKNVLISGE